MFLLCFQADVVSSELVPTAVPVTGFNPVSECNVHCQLPSRITTITTNGKHHTWTNQFGGNVYAEDTELWIVFHFEPVVPLLVWLAG